MNRGPGMNFRDTVVRRHAMMRDHGWRQESLGIEILFVLGRGRIEKHDAHGRVLLQRLPHDPLHAIRRILRAGATIINRKLDNQQVRLMTQELRADAEGAIARAGSTNAGIQGGEGPATMSGNRLRNRCSGFPVVVVRV